MKHAIRALVLALIVTSFHQALSRRNDERQQRSDQPGSAATWSPANKQWVTTSYEDYDASGKYSSRSETAPISKVWLTVGEGILNEVYSPTADEAQVRDQQLLITDGETFFHEERLNTVHSVEWQSSHPLDVVFINKDPEGRYEIRRTMTPDPDADRLWIRLEIKTAVSGLHFYLLHNMAAGNTAAFDTCHADLDSIRAFDAHKPRAQILRADKPFLEVSCGIEGEITDGYQDIRRHLQMTHRLSAAANANTVAVAKLNLEPTSQGKTQETGLSIVELTLNFAPTMNELKRKPLTPGANHAEQRAKYLAQWKKYFSSLKDLSQPTVQSKKLFWVSAAVLKTHEDKTYEGALLASLSIPWGDINPVAEQSGSRGAGGYHLVWPRDMFHVAMAMLAMGDTRSPVAALKRFQALQFKSNAGHWPYDRNYTDRFDKRGSFTQNTWVDGTPYWTQLQMDQVAFPIMLGQRLMERGLVRPDELRFLLDSADFIVRFGPWTAQERWEETYGISPSTAAAELAGLIAGASIAERLGEVERAENYKRIAHQWAFTPNDNIDAWTFTTTGGLGNGRYYTRVDGASRLKNGNPDWLAIWNPNDNAFMLIANLPTDRALFKEKDVMDGGFLELVRHGVKDAMDSFILETLPEYDSELRIETPAGASYYRYHHDGYGDSGKGRLWTHLTGERGHYEIAAGRSAHSELRAMEKFANSGGMLAEQVMDTGKQKGMNIGSATPLAWSHAEYIRLLRSQKDGRVFDTSSTVRSFFTKK